MKLGSPSDALGEKANYQSLSLPSHKTFQFFPVLLPKLKCQEMLGTWPVRIHFIFYRNKLCRTEFYFLNSGGTHHHMQVTKEQLRSYRRPNKDLTDASRLVGTFLAWVETLS